MFASFSKYLFENLQSFVIISALVIAVIIFFHKQAQIEPELLKLKQEFNTFVQQASSRHQELAQSQQESKHNLELSLTKLETSLAQINTDIQFIKHRIVYGDSK